MGSSVPPLGRSGYMPLAGKITAAKEVRISKAVTSVYKKAIAPTRQHNFAGPAIGLISDHNSQFSQLSQALTGYASPAASPPPGLLSYNSLSKSAIQLVEWGSDSLKFIKSNFGYHMSWADRMAYMQKSSYLAYNICSGMNLVKNVVGFFNNQQFTSGVSKAFGNIATAAGSLLAIFSGLRAIKAVGEFYKAYQYKSLLGRCVLVSDKMQALKSLVYVSDEELMADLTDPTQKKAYFKAYFDENIDKIKEKAKADFGLATLPDIGGLVTKMGSKEAREVYKTELGISEETMKDLSPQELWGLLMMKQEKTDLKRNKLISTIAGNSVDGERLVSAIKLASKVQSVCNPNYTETENNAKIEEIFSKVNAMTNRRLLKEGAIIVSCILTIIASITTLACPAAFPLIIVMWVVSNAIEFGVSMKEFSDAAVEKEKTPERVYPKAATWKEWAGQCVTWNKENWRTSVSIAVNIIAIGLVVASLCVNPVTAPLVAVAIASCLALALYSYFNACLLHKGSRDTLVKVADGIDRYINKNITGFFGIDIDIEVKLKKQKVEQSFFIHKLTSLSNEDKYVFLKKLETKRLIDPVPDFLTLKPSDRKKVLSGLNLKIEALVKKDPVLMQALYQDLKSEERQFHMQNIETYKTA